MWQEQLTDLKHKIAEYAGLVENMLEVSIKGLLEKKKDILEDVIEHQEVRVNQYEVEVDEICTDLIARYQPTAVDMRTILMVLKISNDLERMGDHAVNIAESSLYLIERPQVKPLLDIPKMAEHVRGMLNDGIEAFINGDSQLAIDVCQRDNFADEIHEQIMRELITYMVSDSTTIERALHLIRVSSNMERIADLSTNLCEDVTFMVDGKVIKHHIADNKNAE